MGPTPTVQSSPTTCSNDLGEFSWFSSRPLVAPQIANFFVQWFDKILTSALSYTYKKYEK